MSTHSIPSASRVRQSAHPGFGAVPALSTAAALAGLAVVAAGLLLPWVTVLHGTAPLNGIAAGGGTIAGLATASALVLVAARRYDWSPGRWLALGGAAVAWAGSLWAARSVADYAADPGPAAVLASPVPGPGPWVLAVGTVLLAGAALLPIPRGPRSTRFTPTGLGTRLGLAATAFVAGWIHLLLTPEHWGESALLGAGFFAAGVLQLLLSIAVVVRPAHSVHLTLVALNVALVAVWLYAVFIGLPFGDVHDHGSEPGWSVGSGEPVTGVALVTEAAQIAGAVWAAFLASRSIRPGAGQDLTVTASGKSLQVNGAT